jgi:hypothetical protein
MTLGGVRIVVTDGEWSASPGAVCALDGVARANKKTTAKRILLYFDDIVPPLFLISVSLLSVLKGHGLDLGK